MDICKFFQTSFWKVFQTDFRKTFQTDMVSNTILLLLFFLTLFFNCFVEIRRRKFYFCRYAESSKVPQMEAVFTLFFLPACGPLLQQPSYWIRQMRDRLGQSGSSMQYCPVSHFTASLERWEAMVTICCCPYITLLVPRSFHCEALVMPRWSPGYALVKLWW